MIKVLFFASIRERLSADHLILEIDGDSCTLMQLRQRLISSNGPLWSEVLNADNVIAAVNQQVAKDSRLLNDGDEVAFFPPVTGG